MNISDSEFPAEDTFADVPEPLARALTDRGFAGLTAVQKAVLDPATRGRDLRIASQTGSGKTVAVGLVLGADAIERGPKTPAARGEAARPATLVVAPTRELASQVASELTWLFAGIPLRVAVVTGGTPMGGDFRSLRADPDVLVGTPGRLVDHLERGSLVLEGARTVVLDEADEMLDLGFRDELEAILRRLPEERTVHLVSATFAGDVLAIADRYQRGAKLVEGTKAGRPNEDIAHVAHVVRAHDRPSAIVNLLLAEGDARTLVFVRTRADATDLGERLAADGFAARALSGEMGQRERTATLEAFRSGTIRVLVATDVAARGLDVQGISLVIHHDLPGSAETLTHRSGRTGRAGAKGTSVLLVPPEAKGRASRLLRTAGIFADLRPLPLPSEIEAAMEQRAVHTLATAQIPEADAPRLKRLSRTLLEARDPEALVAVLLARSGIDGPCAPRTIASMEPPRARRDEPRPVAKGRAVRDRDVAGEREVKPRAPRAHAPSAADRETPRAHDHETPRAHDHEAPSAREHDAPRAREREAAPRGRERAAQGAESGYVAFQVSFGAEHGADPRRLLAIVCRRGDVTREDVGAIRVGPMSSVVEIVAERAGDFADRAMAPDPRDPRVRFRPFDASRGPSRVVTQAGRKPPRRKG